MVETGEAPATTVGGPDAFALEAYKQVCDDFRQLNQAFWQAPVIIVSITGGIGFAVATVDSWYLRVGLLILATACNGAWAAVILRLRSGVMRHLLVQKREFEDFHLGRAASDRPDKQIIMWIFVALLVAVATGCFVSAFFVGTLFPKKDDDKKAIANASVNLAAPARACPVQTQPAAKWGAPQAERTNSIIHAPADPGSRRNRGTGLTLRSEPRSTMRLRPTSNPAKCSIIRVRTN